MWCLKVTITFILWIIWGFILTFCHFVPINALNDKICVWYLKGTKNNKKNVHFTQTHRKADHFWSPYLFSLFSSVSEGYVNVIIVHIFIICSLLGCEYLQFYLNYGSASLELFCFPQQAAAYSAALKAWVKHQQLEFPLSGRSQKN